MEGRRLGNYLREGRLAAGLTLEEMAQRTRIPRRSLEALEEDRLDLLPQTVFVRGFVRAFCQQAHMDPGPALEQLVARAEAEAEAPSGHPTLNAPSRALYLAPVSLDVNKGLRISHFLLVVAALVIFVAAYLVAGGREAESGASAAAGEARPSLVHPSPDAGRDGAEGNAVPAGPAGPAGTAR